jgi:GTP cyclohydrolase subunit MoaA
MVAMKGTNDDEIDDMVAFCIEQGFTLRLIETMPMAPPDATALTLTCSRSKRALPAIRPDRRHLPRRRPARYLATPDGAFSVGFITPISQHFCETCNRVRLSVEARCICAWDRKTNSNSVRYCAAA